MAGQEYKGKDKIVQKLTKEGLVEENLRKGSVKSIHSEPPSRAAPLMLEKELEQKEEPEEEDAGKSAYRSKRQKLNQMRRYASLSESAKKPDTVTKKQAVDQEFRYGKRLSDHEKIPDGDDLSKKKASIKKKRQRQRLVQEQKKVSKLSFEDEKGVISRAGKLGVSAAGTMSAVYLHGKLKEAEDDNSAVEGAHAGELAAEDAAKSLRSAQTRMNRTSGRLARKGYRESEVPSNGRLRFSESEGGVGEAVKGSAKTSAKEAAKEQEKKRTINRFWQKKRYKDSYIAARRGKKTGDAVVGSAGNAVAETFAEKAKKATEEIILKNKAIFIAIGLMALLFGMVSISLTSCTSSIQGAGSLIGTTTYPSTDNDIHAAENAYKALETALNNQINSIESRYPGYDEYRYNLAEISHNPYHLISYLTVKYGEFTYADVEQAIKDLFAAQYGLDIEGSTKTETTTKTVRVGESLGNVVTSAYCSCPICCGQWSGGPTASGVMPRANHTIAVDAYNPTVPMGTKVVMNGVEYTVEDTGAFARYGVDFDVYYDSHSAAQAHGHQTWEAFIADDNGSREVEVTQTTTKKILSVTLTKGDFDAFARQNLDAEELIVYNALNTTYGNRDYLFDITTLPVGGDGMSYAIPPEALSDQKFANMIHEAEKYLGYPYVWGGASPSTSFDCSGFVSWVINNCGNGWSYGRLTADGLRGVCTYVSPDQAKPGDLIFFQNTYNTSGASHVGIYVGNGMMIHCGDPIKYSNINTSYWQEHFLCFGRLP